MKKILLSAILLLVASGCAVPASFIGLERLDSGFREGCNPMVFGDRLYYSVSDSSGSYLIYNSEKVTNKGYSRIDMTTLRVFSDGNSMFVGYDQSGEGIIASTAPEVVQSERRYFNDAVAEYSKTHELLKSQKPDSRGCTVVNSQGDDIVDYEKTFYVSCNGEPKSASYGFIYEDSIAWFGDRLAFKASNGLNDEFVVFDGKELGSGVFKFVTNIVFHNGNLIFCADTKTEGPYHIYAYRG